MPYIPNRQSFNWSPLPDPKYFIPAVIGLLVLLLLVVRLAFGQEIKINTIIKIESSGNPNAVSRTGCIGLMQISEVVLKEFNLRSWKTFDSKEENPLPLYNPPEYNLGDLYNPSINVEIGTWYLNRRIPEMLRYYHKEVTIDNILWAYNAGIGNLIKGIKPKETRDYIKKYHKLAKQ